MEQKKNMPNPLIRRLVQNAVRREKRGWPPDTPASVYQPRRPDKPLADVTPDKTKKMEA